MDENNKNNTNNQPNKDIFDEMYRAKEEADSNIEPEEKPLFAMDSESQGRLFKKIAFGSALAGIIFGGILVFFFGKYM